MRYPGNFFNLYKVPANPIINFLSSKEILPYWFISIFINLFVKEVTYYLIVRQTFFFFFFDFFFFLNHPSVFFPSNFFHSKFEEGKIRRRKKSELYSVCMAFRLRREKSRLRSSEFSYKQKGPFLFHLFFSHTPFLIISWKEGSVLETNFPPFYRQRIYILS